MKKISGIIISLVLIIGLFFVLTIYDGELSAPVALSKVISAAENIKSVEFEKSESMELSDVILPQREETISHIKELCGTNDKYMETEIISNGVSSGKFSLYILQEKDGISVYAGDGESSWLKDKTDKKTLSNLGIESESFDIVLEYLRKISAEKIEKENIDGKEVIVISGSIVNDDVEENIRGTMSREALEEMKEEYELFKDLDVDKVFSQLEPITMTVIADADSFLPLEISIDMKETIGSLYENLFHEMGYDGTGFKIPNEALVNVKVICYNSFEKIELPESAANANEFDFFQ